MENNYLKTLAGDLLALEINTIIKEDTSAAKMSSNRRIVILDIANGYRELLIDYGLCQLADGQAPKPNEFGRPKNIFRWQYAGEESFKEIVKYAQAGIDYYQATIKNLTDEHVIGKLERRIKRLGRALQQSSNMIGMFKERRKQYSANDNAQSGLSTKIDSNGVNSEFDAFPPQLNSITWNNDIGLKEMNSVGEFELSPDEIALLRKIWEIGTQQVLLQTVVQIDGDITCYVTNSFIELPDDIKKIALNMHNDSIHSATSYWSSLFNTITNLAGKAFTELFSKKK